MIAFPFIAGLVIKYRGWEDAWLVLGVLVWVLALGPVSMLVRQSPESVGLLPDGDLPTQQDGETPADSPVDEQNWTLKEAMRTPT